MIIEDLNPQITLEDNLLCPEGVCSSAQAHIFAVDLKL
jgi:hypothetical protein